MNNEHACHCLPPCGIYLQFDEATPAWTLHIQKEASASDLEKNHHLESIGDTLWLTCIEVCYCPFCGERLPGLESVDQTQYGHFQHHDFSRWK